ncbi:hypothetical protein U1Q18_018287 [Sarracenia purpurea var. burkii]
MLLTPALPSGVGILMEQSQSLVKGMLKPFDKSCARGQYKGIPLVNPVNLSCGKSSAICASLYLVQPCILLWGHGECVLMDRVG